MVVGLVIQDRFKLESVAGRGGMGVVYRAKDLTTGEPVAVKLMTSLSDNEIARFLREQRLLANIVHPSVVRYIDHGGTPDERLYLVMEWLEGEDLSKRLHSGPLPIADTLAIARATAGALSAAHARGVVHRDIKPSNLFLIAGDPRRVKVLDFGIAREGSHAMAITSSSEIIGTAGYMAPEQIDGTRHTDTRADLFALGSVLYECLTGERAFPGDNMLAVMAKVVCQEVPSVRALRPDVPEALDALITRLMDKEPDNRPRDGEELLAEIAAIESGVSPRPAPRPQRTIEVPDHNRPVNVILVDPNAWQESTDLTITSADVARRRAQVWAIVSRFGADFARMASGALIVSLSADGDAAQLADRAAACAVALREAFPNARVALASSRTATPSASMVGPAIDRAASLLGAGHPAEREGAILLDATLASLLEGRRRIVGEGTTRAMLYDGPTPSQPPTIR